MASAPPAMPKIFEDAAFQGDSVNIDDFYQGLDRAFESGEPPRISGYLQSALAQAEKENDRHAIISILNEIMGYFRNTSRYSEAISASERALAEMRALGYEGTVSYGTTLLNSATIYRAIADNPTALKLFTEALVIFQTNLSEDDYRLAGVYNNVSSIYEESGQYGDALKTLQRALEILQKNEGMEGNTAIVQTNIAMVLFKMNLEDEALAELESAFELFTPDGPGGAAKPGPHYAAALAGVGEAYYRMGRYDEAAQVYEDALAHIESVFGKNKDYAVTCRNCAMAYEDMGKSDMAEKRRALADSIYKELGLNGEG